VKKEPDSRNGNQALEYYYYDKFYKLSEADDIPLQKFHKKIHPFLDF